MDRTGKDLDNLNMSEIVSPVPVYALYGEKSELPFADRLHWETLASRSSLYDFHISPHRHEQLFQVLHLTRGVAEVTLESSTRTIAPPAVIIVPALTIHAYRFDRDVGGTVLTLFEADVRAMLDAHAETAGSLATPTIIVKADLALTQSIASLLDEAGRHSEARGLALSGRVSMLLAELVRASRRAVAANQPAPQPAVRHAQAFQRLVEQEFTRQQPLAFYAAALGITPSHLNRTANAVLGASAMAVVERRVMHEARRFLVFTTMPVKQIAYALGYTDPAYFSRAFSRSAGMPPERFRAQRTHPVAQDRARE
jgi:AraC family transcriptional activator of pobA